MQRAIRAAAESLTQDDTHCLSSDPNSALGFVLRGLSATEAARPPREAKGCVVGGERNNLKSQISNLKFHNILSPPNLTITNRNGWLGFLCGSSTTLQRVRYDTIRHDAHAEPFSVMRPEGPVAGPEIYIDTRGVALIIVSYRIVARLLTHGGRSVYTFSASSFGVCCARGSLGLRGWPSSVGCSYQKSLSLRELRFVQ